MSFHNAMPFRNAKSLVIAATFTAFGVVGFGSSSANAQVYVERVVDVTCVDTLSSYAGTITINGAAYRISTLRPILEQVARAFQLEGYDTRFVGEYLRAYTDVDGPEIDWLDGEYNLCIRPRNGYYLISVESFPTYIVVHENVGYGFSNGVCIGSGYAYEHCHVPVYYGPCITPDGFHIDIHFDFSPYYSHHHYRHGFHHHDRDEWRNRHDHDNDHGHDRWRGHDSDRGGDNRRGDDRGGGNRGGDNRRDDNNGLPRAGERTGDRSRTGGERIINGNDKPIDGGSKPGIDQPRVDEPRKDSGRTGGERVVRPGQDRTGMPGGARSGSGGSGSSGGGATKTPTDRTGRERVIVKEPDAVKRPPASTPPSAKPPSQNNPPANRGGASAGGSGGSGRTGNERVLPKPLPIQSPSVNPAPRQTPKPEAPRPTVKEPSRQPAKDQTSKSPSGNNNNDGKRDRRW